MTKDPAFLLYSKDWLQGTAEMTHQEKGVFMDLLCHQHQTGSLPADPKRLARLAGMGEGEFMEVWATLSEKFLPVYDANALPNASAFAPPNADAFANATADRVANKKLVSVMGERKDNAHVNYIISVWSHILRESDLPKAEKDKIRKQFKVNDFKKYSREEVSERIREWWCERTCVRTHSLEDAIAIGNEDGNEDIGKGGVGEKPKSELPSAYIGRKLEVPAGWPEDQFRKSWDEWRIYRKRRHRFVFDSVDTEQSAVRRLADEVKGEDWNWIQDCMKFCMEKGWMSIIPSAYRKHLSNLTHEKSHNSFSKKATPI